MHWKCSSRHHFITLLQQKIASKVCSVHLLCHLLNWALKGLCHQSITTKLNMKILSSKMVMAPIVQKKSCNSFKMWQCDWNHSNTHVMTRLLFFGLKFCPNVKIKYEKRIFDHFFFWKKSHWISKKIKNHVVTFSYWFWLGNKILNV
jgi:hypothetical protein